jgi:hypothetical protein
MFKVQGEMGELPCSWFVMETESLGFFDLAAVFVGRRIDVV